MPTQAHPSIRGAMTAYVMAVLWLAEGLSRGEEKKRREVILAQMGRLTDNSNVAVDGEGATPRDGAEVGPLVVQSPRRAGEELAHQGEDDEADHLREHGGGDRETLDDEVRDVEVGGLGQVLSQDGRGAGRVVHDLLSDGRGGRAHGGDEEDLENLEAEAGVLREQLDAGERRLTGELGTHYGAALDNRRQGRRKNQKQQLNWHTHSA